MDKHSQTENLEDWIGNTQECADVVTAAQANRLAAVLNLGTKFQADDHLPLLWHWAYLTEPVLQQEIASDGHARRGGFLPPISLPRRMWAGSNIVCHAPLAIGETVVRTSIVENIESKQGRSGPLIFLTVLHSYYVGDQARLTETQQIVYREHSPFAPGNPQPENTRTSAFSVSHKADITELFRYSALTFNAHRIHYDREYVTQEEGYPGLIVHGPLLATKLLEGLSHEVGSRDIAEFEFKALNPVFENEKFVVKGNSQEVDGQWDLWIENADGLVCMEAKARTNQS